MTTGLGLPPANTAAGSRFPPAGATPPPLPRPKVEPARVQTVRRAIGSAFLPANQKNLLRTLLEEVDWTTWSCPTSEDEEGKGCSMEYLAHRTGWTSRRNCQKVMALLVAAGLVTRVIRPWDYNYLRLEVEQILTAGQVGKEERDQFLAEQRAAGKLPRPLHRPPAAAPDADPPAALFSSPTPRPARPAASARPGRSPEPGAAELPAWAYDAAQRHTLPASTIHAAVVRLVDALVGDKAPVLLQSSDASKKVLGRWMRDGRPELAGWVDQALVELEVLRTCTARWAVKRREHGHHRSLKFLRSGNQLLELRMGTEAHRRGVCQCRHLEHAVQAPTPPQPLPSPEDWLAHGRRMGPWAGTSTWRSWAGAAPLLRDRLGLQDFDIWIEPLVPLAEGEVTWLGAPSAAHAEWVGSRYAAVLTEIVGTVGLVCLP